MMFLSKLWQRNGHRTDADIAAEVYQTLRRYAPIYTTKAPIQVEVIDGVATLRGVVVGAALCDMAEQLAAAVDGVKSVRNELLDDPAIERAIAWALAIQPHLRLLTNVVRLKSYRGVVTLAGSVSSQAHKETAEAVTRSVPGVRDVVNRLVVSPEGNSCR